MRTRTAALALLWSLTLGCPARTTDLKPADAGMTAEQLQREQLLADALKGLQCPAGTRRVGDEPPAGFEVWCEKAEAVREGPYRAWHPDGTRSVVGQYASGQRDGEWAEWFENGQRKTEISYQKGTPEGRFTQWDENGDVVSKGTYERGRLKGNR